MKRYKDIAGDGGSNIAGQVEAQQGRLKQRLESVRAIVAIVSGKGGVGKSTLTASLACAFALDGWKVGVLDADLNGPTQAKVLGVRGRRLVIADGVVEPPSTDLGVKVMSMDLLLPTDATPLTWDAPVQDEAHTWRGAMEANALREFLADTNWGTLDLLASRSAARHRSAGDDRVARARRSPGIVVVTIPSDVSHLVVRRSITVAANTRAPVLGLVENMSGLFVGPDATQARRRRRESPSSAACRSTGRSPSPATTAIRSSPARRSGWPRWRSADCRGHPRRAGPAAGVTRGRTKNIGPGQSRGRGVFAREFPQGQLIFGFGV